MRLGLVSFIAGFLWLVCLAPRVQAQPSNAAPAFSEVYQLLRAHLSGTDDAKLNQTAVQALIGALSPRVALVSNPPAGQEPAALLSRSNVFDREIAYLRVEQVRAGLPAAVRAAYQKLAQSNRLNGVVLDLRFAGGTDYAAAAATADLFLKQERPLLDWGKGLTQSTSKQDAIMLPLALLVNSHTSGAAEALAAILRQTSTALVLGGRTAGEAAVMQEYALSTGQKLQIAVAPIRLGDGTGLSAQGVKPDIAVEVAPQEERAYLADAYRDVSSSNTLAGAQASSTNRVRRPRFNEAELVRERKEGVADPFEAPERMGGAPEAVEPVVHDPVLARALDVLKGLALVRPSHP